MSLYLIIRPSLMSHFYPLPSPYPLPLETSLKGVATKITLTKCETSSRTRHVIGMLLWLLCTQMQYGLGWECYSEMCQIQYYHAPVSYNDANGNFR